MINSSSSLLRNPAVGGQPRHKIISSASTLDAKFGAPVEYSGRTPLMTDSFPLESVLENTCRRN